MKKLIFIIPILFSCKTKKNSKCDAYSEFIYKDTVTITTEHIHYNNKCSSDTTIRTPITDTFLIKKYKND